MFRALTSLVARARFEREMREELRFHIERRADDLSAHGVPRDEALRRARVEFGAMESLKEQCRDESGFAPFRPLHGLAADLRHAARRLVAAPVFTLFAVISLSLGLGVVTTFYSIIDKVLWKDLVVRDPGRLMLLTGSLAGPYDPRYAASMPDFEDLSRTQASFDVLSASQPVFPAVARHGITELLSGEAVDGSYFATLGITPRYGRLIQASDVQPPAPVVVLSHAFWTDEFGADAGAIGRTVRLGGRPFEIVGIAPDGFEGAVPGFRGAQLWVPLSTTEWIRPRGAARLPERDRRLLTVIGRLKETVDVSTAVTEVSEIGKSLDAAHPPHDRSTSGVPARRAWIPRTVTELDQRGDSTRRFGMVLFVVVLLVLVVACTNLANLVLARGATRHQEIAVRGALGASRWRLVREQMAESVILALAGGGLSIVVLLAMRQWLDTALPLSGSLSVSIQPQLNVELWAATALGLFVALLVFGVEPALLLTRKMDVRTELAATSGTVGVPKAKRQRRLLRWQVAISMGFFIVATMCIRSLVREAGHDPGVRLEGLGIVSVSFYSQGWDEERGRRAIDRVALALKSSGLEASAVSTGMPFGTTITPWADLSTPDRPIGADHRDGANLVAVTPGYFKAAGTRLLLGRDFDERDAIEGPRVVILGQAAARDLFGTSDAVGRQVLMRVRTRGFRVDEPVRIATVIGIAEDTDTTHYFLRRGGVAYAPLAQEYMPNVTLIGRSQSAAAAVSGLLRALRSADPELAVGGSGTAHAVLAGRYAFVQAAGMLAVTLGALTMLLAMSGLYGVQSHVVSHRTREIGVRMSLGATASEIKRMVLKEGYGPVFQGLAIGLFIGLTSRAVIRAFVFERLDVVDPWVLLAPVPLIVAAFLACWLPAHRASRVDPNVALRHL